VLGTATGICNTVHYLDQVPPDQHFLTFVRGCEESLHNLVLALIILVIANLIGAVIAFRNRGAAVR
jgi:hypothetical protein